MEEEQQSDQRWHILLRLRWPLALGISLVFIIGQLVETWVFGRIYSLLDIILWGTLAGIAVWLSLTWVSHREKLYKLEIEQALTDQRDLNTRLQRANAHLALLSEVNQHIAESATIDEILNSALAFPQRLVPAQAAALLLRDSSGMIATRVERLSADALSELQLAFDLHANQNDQHYGAFFKTIQPARHGFEACCVLALHDGMALVGRIELYLPKAIQLADDERALLETIASEIAEAIVSARRRSREERAIYELERAITEERARIARDIHDGLTQTLAFQRMRVDLWLDWLESDQPRLRQELIGLKERLREQIVELRRAIFALRPVQFDELGFLGGMQRYIHEFASQQGWEVRIDMSSKPFSLSPDLEALCFRVIQEALTNAAKHAQARTVTVRVEQIDQELRIMVADDGQGFDTQQIPSNALGLRQMRERLGALRGELTILSKQGQGSELRAWIPLPTDEGDADSDGLRDRVSPPTHDNESALMRSKLTK